MQLLHFSDSYQKASKHTMERQNVSPFKISNFLVIMHASSCDTCVNDLLSRFRFISFILLCNLFINMFSHVISLYLDMINFKTIKFKDIKMQLFLIEFLMSRFCLFCCLYTELCGWLYHSKLFLESN